MTPAASAADLDRAAAAITAARRPLVTGLVGAAATVALAACDLAEAAGAAVDPGSPETSRIVGPLLARVGAVTAAAEELRDRADLVVLWFCDPERTAAGFIDRFIAPPLPAAARRTLAVGPHDARPRTTHHRHVDVPAAAAIDVARLVEAMVRGMAIDHSPAAPTTLAAARDVAAAVAAAHTVALVTDWSADPVGLAAWSAAAVVQALAHTKPAFEIPLGERDDAATAVCTWRYGAAGAIDRADRGGARFHAAEADAVRLIDRRDVDCIVVVGEATADVAAAIDRAEAQVVVRLPADETAVRRVADRVAAAGATA